MESSKGVIQVIRKASHPTGYDEIYYLSEFGVDEYGKIFTNLTGDVWKAQHFAWENVLNKYEQDRIDKIVELVRISFPKKEYNIEFKPITLTY